jgi:S1-C subfamily serine protease
MEVTLTAPFLRVNSRAKLDPQALVRYLAHALASSRRNKMRSPLCLVSYVALAALMMIAGWSGLFHSAKPIAQAQEARLPGKDAAQPSPPADMDLSPDEMVNIYVYQRANRGVVNITTHSQVEDFFFTVPREGSGSGSVIDKQGHLLTNYHVIEDARQINVTIFDGSSYQAQLVGYDPNNDLAVLQIDAPASKLHPIPWGDSSRLQVGLKVLAIGNPFGLERTLTTGIVSSLNRSLRSENHRLIRGIIQTDAAINPGNSGGPLLNRRGEMVGITTAIVGRAAQSSGVGLAIPAKIAKQIVAELIEHGHVTRPEIGIANAYQTDKGLLIASLVQDGAAERAGLRGPKVVVIRRNGFEYRTIDRTKADLVIGVDGRRIRTLDDLLSYVETKKVGDKVVLNVIRDGEQIEVPVELDETRS